MKPLALSALATVVLGGQAVILAQASGHKTGSRTRWACYGHCSSSETKEYDMAASNYSGVTVRGPRTIVARNLNLLRYDYKFNSTVSFAQAPDVFSKLLSVNAGNAPASSAAPTVSKAEKSPPSAKAAQAQAQSLSQMPRVRRPQVLTKARPPTKPAPSKDWLPEREAVLALAGRANKFALDAYEPISNAEALIEDAVGSADQIEKLQAAIDEDSQKFNHELLTANIAINAVTAAGQNVKDFLKTSSGLPTLIISGIASELMENPPPSAFMTGVKASWTHATVVATLRRNSEFRKADLDKRKSNFDDTLPGVLADLNVSKQLESVLNEIDSETTKREIDAQKGDQEAGAQLETLNKAGTSVKGRLDEIRDRRLALRKTKNLLEWAMKANDRILSAVPDLEQTSDKYKAFRAAQDGLISWAARMKDLKNRFDAQGAEAFSMSTPADCEFAFSRTKTTAITLTRTDLLPGTTATGPETVLSVTVECTSPFAVSAGVAFSNIGEREFAIQPVATPNGSTTTTNEFVSVTKSRFHPLPMGVIHARICEYGDLLSINAGFGVAGNFRSQTSGGSNAEFLLGPSFGLFRTMFITLGLHLGQKVHLGAGFQEGQQVPPNITTPPLQKSYVAGFGLAITFTKP